MFRLAVAAAVREKLAAAPAVSQIPRPASPVGRSDARVAPPQEAPAVRVVDAWKVAGSWMFELERGAGRPRVFMTDDVLRRNIPGVLLGFLVSRGHMTE
jgi:hypothetical protein